MSDNNAPKLGKVKLNEAERKAIAEMVESEGFKVWKRKLIPAREIVIGGLCTNAAQTVEDLWYYKGMSYENGKPIQILEGIAKKYHDNQINEDAED